jgi:hypothetical protein
MVGWSVGRSVSWSVSQSVSLGVEPHLVAHDEIFITFSQLRSCFHGVLFLMERTGLSCLCCWPLPVQSFLGSCPLGLTSIFYCLYETSFFVASYDSQCHGGGIQPHLYMDKLSVNVGFLLYSLRLGHAENMSIA